MPDTLSPTPRGLAEMSKTEQSRSLGVMRQIGVGTFAIDAKPPEDEVSTAFESLAGQPAGQYHNGGWS